MPRFNKNVSPAGSFLRAAAFALAVSQGLAASNSWAQNLTEGHAPGRSLEAPAHESPAMLSSLLRANWNWNRIQENAKEITDRVEPKYRGEPEDLGYRELLALYPDATSTAQLDAARALRNAILDKGFFEQLEQRVLRVVTKMSPEEIDALPRSARVDLLALMDTDAASMGYNKRELAELRYKVRAGSARNGIDLASGIGIDPVYALSLHATQQRYNREFVRDLRNPESDLYVCLVGASSDEERLQILVDDHAGAHGYEPPDVLALDISRWMGDGVIGGSLAGYLITIDVNAMTGARVSGELLNLLVPIAHEEGGHAHDFQRLLHPWKVRDDSAWKAIETHMAADIQWIMDDLAFHQATQSPHQKTGREAAATRTPQQQAEAEDNDAWMKRHIRAFLSASLAKGVSAGRVSETLYGTNLTEMTSKNLVRFAVDNPEIRRAILERAREELAGRAEMHRLYGGERPPETPVIHAGPTPNDPKTGL